MGTIENHERQGTPFNGLDALRKVAVADGKPIKSIIPRKKIKPRVTDAEQKRIEDIRNGLGLALGEFSLALGFATEGGYPSARNHT